MTEPENQNLSQDNPMSEEELNTTPLAASEGEHAPVLGENDELLEMNEDFNFEDFQVVRREFFAHIHEPSVSFNCCKFYVNSACLTKFPDLDFAQVLIDQDKKIMALRPCSEEARDSFPWCSLDKKGKRKPKPITCKLFFAKVVSMMGWNPDFRYKLLGKLIHTNGEYLIAFDLSSTEVYQKTFPEGEKPKTSRVPVFPAEWQNQFGLPVNEHRQSMQINVFENYAIYTIKDNVPEEPKNNVAEQPTETVEQQALPLLNNYNGGNNS